jgi:hypothetical protein
LNPICSTDQKSMEMERDEGTQEQGRAPTPESQTSQLKSDPALAEYAYRANSIYDLPKGSKLKLDGSNYPAWRAQVDVLLDLQGLTDVTEKPVDREDTRWVQSNRRARAFLFTACTDEVQVTHLIGLTTGVSILKSLDEIYRPQGRKQRYQRRIRLHTLEWESHQNASQFVAAFKKAVRDAVEAGSTIDEESQICQLLHTSQAKFPTWTDVKLASWTDASPLYINALCNELMDMAVTVDTAVALTAQQGNRPYKAKCSHCKKSGHDEKNCYKKHPDKAPAWYKEKQKADSAASTTSAAGVLSLTATLPPVTLPVGLLTTVERSWIVDSGASRHMCQDRDVFVSYEAISPIEITAAKGTIRAVGVGSIRLDLTNSKGRVTPILLKQVLYVPGLVANLLSTNCLRSSGAYFHGGTCTLHQLGNDAEFGHAPPQNGVNILRAVAVAPKAVLAAPATTPQVSIETWHRRLGHLGKASLKKLKLHEDTEFSKSHCAACRLGDAPKQISRTPQVRAAEPFDLIHIDAIGPITPQGFNHDRWGITFTDDCTRYKWFYSMPTKGGAAAKIREFFYFIQTQTGKTIKRFRLDNGKEFGGAKLTALAQHEGTHLEFSAPYTPEQNGVSEAANRVIPSRARRMMIDGRVPTILWPEGVRAAAYISNRTPTKALPDGRSPQQCLADHLGIKGPEWTQYGIEYLRVYGCRAYVRIPDPRRQKGAKFDERAYQGILVGYEGQNGHIYRVYVPKKGLIRSRDVRFDEASTPGIPEDPQQSYPETTIAGLIPVLGAGEQDEAQSRIQPAQTPTQTQAEQHANPSQDSGGGETELQETSIERDLEQDPQQDPGQVTQDLEENWEQDPEQDREQDSDPDQDVQESEQRFPARINRGKRPQRYAAPAWLPEQTSLPEPALFAFTAAIEGVDTQKTPRNLKEALASPDAHEWMEAMLQEIKALNAMKTWKLVPLPRGRRAMPGKWLFKIKTDENGIPARYKARWCARGDQQRHGIDYTETYAAVARSTTFRTCMALCARYGLLCHQMDVITAFLNGEMETGIDVYVVQPYGFEEQGDLVCHLRKALYGLKQSPRLWYERFTRYLCDILGFTCLHADACLFRKEGIILLLYVDDLLIIAKQIDDIDGLKQALAREFSMQDLGNAAYYLGIRIVRKDLRGPISLVQDAYTKKILAQAGMEQCKIAYTPMEHHLHQEMIDPEAEGVPDPKQYQALVGSLLFLAVQTRPDLAFAVGWLARHCHRPLTRHEQALKRVLRYLRGTVTHGITYTVGDLLGYSDASYAEDPETRKSTSGYLYMLSGGPISWRSSRQELVTTSSTEAEYVGYSSAAKEAAWIRGILGELEIPVTSVPLHVDNESAISMAKNNVYRPRTKHIDVRYHYIRQEVHEGRIKLSYLPSEEMPADGLTKPLQRILFQRFLSKLNLKAIHGIEAF